MIAPCGKPMKAIRFAAVPAGVAAHAVAAGFIASSSGRATAAPTPLSTVRREMCFFDRNMSVSLRRDRSADPALRLSGPLPRIPPYTLPCQVRVASLTRLALLLCRCRLRLCRRNASHPELIALDHRLHQRREPVIGCRGAVDDPAHR